MSSSRPQTTAGATLELRAAWLELVAELVTLYSRTWAQARQHSLGFGLELPPPPLAIRLHRRAAELRDEWRELEA